MHNTLHCNGNIDDSIPFAFLALTVSRMDTELCLQCRPSLALTASTATPVMHHRHQEQTPGEGAPRRHVRDGAVGARLVLGLHLHLARHSKVGHLGMQRALAVLRRTCQQHLICATRTVARRSQSVFEPP